MKLAVIPGDGIGPEVVAQALLVLTKLRPDIDTTHFDLGAERYHRTGELLPDKDLVSLKNHDAILFGAVGDPSIPPGILERGLLLKMRFELDQFVNLRPAKTFTNLPTPLENKSKIDIVVVREGTEGLYLGVGGVVKENTSAEIATEVSVNTYAGIYRTAKYAFELASQRKNQLTYVHKTNVLQYAGKLWQRIMAELEIQYPQVKVSYVHVDAASMFLVTNPVKFDVIVTDNLFGDIITDLAAAVTGGIGYAASGNINPTNQFPSMFEPVHGSAPDIAGKGKANPIAAVLSVAMLLNHYGDSENATKIEKAVNNFSAVDITTLTTEDIGTEIITAL